jgi:hydroxymethylglutaryl-CoA synthase
MQVGISRLALALPRRYVAASRGNELAVADPGEDTVALAATAALRLVRDPTTHVERLGMLVVGTQSAIDHVKPVASFVHGLLGLPRAMRTFDTQHATYAGTAALMAACDWIASGGADGASALVVCADAAPARPGCAVAMLVSEDPEILAIDGASGVFSADEAPYLEALPRAYAMWRERSGASSEDLAAIVYDAPSRALAREGHARVRALDGLAPSAASFAAKVAPSLALARRIGDAQTASLYLGLASLLRARPARLAGRRIGLFSHGGASEFFSGVVDPRAARAIAAAGIDELLAARTRIGRAEYERIRRLAPDPPPPEVPAPGAFRFTGFVDTRRTYACV